MQNIINFFIQPKKVQAFAIPGLGDFQGRQPEEIVSNFILKTLGTYVFPLLGAIAVGSVIWGGFLLITSGGDEKKVARARTVIITSVIAIVLTLVLPGILSWFIDILGKSI